MSSSTVRNEVGFSSCGECNPPEECDTHSLDVRGTKLINAEPTGFKSVRRDDVVWIGSEKPEHKIEESRLNNPYSKQECSDLEAVLKFVDHLHDEMKKSYFQSYLKTLEGKTLACECLPELCHGQTILLYLAYYEIGNMRGDKVKNTVKRTLEHVVKDK